jgi:RHS repeat-associated protein
MATTNLAAFESESVVESLDYYPYGGQRIDSKTNYGGVRNKYAGTVYDPLSRLNYMQARYQNSARGQFVSEDPVFLGDPTQQDLTDPQSLNSYSYANDNPITKSDPTGNFGAAALAPLAFGATDLGLAATVEFWGPPVAIGALGVGAIILASNGWSDVAQKAANYNNNRTGGSRFIPFSDQSRMVKPPSAPDREVCT